MTSPTSNLHPTRARRAPRLSDPGENSKSVSAVAAAAARMPNQSFALAGSPSSCMLPLAVVAALVTEFPRPLPPCLYPRLRGERVEPTEEGVGVIVLLTTSFPFPFPCLCACFASRIPLPSSFTLFPFFAFLRRY